MLRARKKDALHHASEYEGIAVDIEKTQDGSTLTVRVSGRINMTTSPQLEAELIPSLDGIETLIIDFSKLEYISSAGLRVLLTARKKIGAGDVIIRGTDDVIAGVFEATGFATLFTME